MDSLTRLFRVFQATDGYLSQELAAVYFGRSPEHLARFKRHGLFLEGDRWLKSELDHWHNAVVRFKVRFTADGSPKGDVKGLRAWIESFEIERGRRAA